MRSRVLLWSKWKITAALGSITTNVYLEAANLTAKEVLPRQKLEEVFHGNCWSIGIDRL